MTEPEDSSSSRPISVAELLARNGTIGSPPVGGRRRRRRGNADAVTVAELTGEIPVVTDEDDEPQDTEQFRAQTDEVGDERARHDERSDERDGAASVTATAAAPVETDAERTDTDGEPHEDLDARDADASPVHVAPPQPAFRAEPDRRPSTVDTSGAEQMSPDPFDDEEDPFDSPVDLADPPEIDYGIGDLDEVDTLDDTDHERVDGRDKGKSRSGLRSTHDELFGGPTVTDRDAETDDADTDEQTDTFDDDVEVGGRSRLRAILSGAWVVVQCLLAVAFGAGLFLAFDQLWQWNSVVTLVLSMLVILGLVAGVRVVRKTEDITSTMIAVVVGALVTFGPLALQLQAS